MGCASSQSLRVAALEAELERSKLENELERSKTVLEAERLASAKAALEAELARSTAEHAAVLDRSKLETELERSKLETELERSKTVLEAERLASAKTALEAARATALQAELAGAQAHTLNDSSSQTMEEVVKLKAELERAKTELAASAQLAVMRAAAERGTLEDPRGERVAALEAELTRAIAEHAAALERSKLDNELERSNIALETEHLASAKTALESQAARVTALQAELCAHTPNDSSSPMEEVVKLKAELERAKTELAQHAAALDRSQARTTHLDATPQWLKDEELERAKRDEMRTNLAASRGEAVASVRWMKRIGTPHSTALSQFSATDTRLVKGPKMRTCAGVSPSTPFNVSLLTSAGMAPACPIAARHSLLFAHVHTHALEVARVCVCAIAASRAPRGNLALRLPRGALEAASRRPEDVHVCVCAQGASRPPRGIYVHTSIYRDIYMYIYVYLRIYICLYRRTRRPSKSPPTPPRDSPRACGRCKRSWPSWCCSPPRQAATSVMEPWRVVAGTAPKRAAIVSAIPATRRWAAGTPRTSPGTPLCRSRGRPRCSAPGRLPSRCCSMARGATGRTRRRKPRR